MNATKVRFGRADLAALFAGARRVVVAKGRSSRTIELAPRAALPTDLVDAVLGPTGNLRAPAVRIGTTWLVGFSAEAWEPEFGAR